MISRPPPTAVRQHGAALAVLLAVAATLPDSAAAQDKDSIVTDRPDFVESSDVVGIGRLQIETSVAFERNRTDSARDRLTSTPTLLRFGVADAWELRLETDGRLIAHSTDLDNGHTERSSGYADTSLGVKWHALDAAGNWPSVGLLAHADLDSGSAPFRGAGVRPSLRLAAEWELADDFGLGLMPGLIYDKDAAGQRYVGAIFGIVLGKTWHERLRAFVELAAPQLARASHGGSVSTFDTGLAYLLTPTCQIDSAIARGLNHNTPDWSWTVGLSVKL